MLFAVWTENRATEETERISVGTPSLRSLSLHDLSRTNTISNLPPPPSPVPGSRPVSIIVPEIHDNNATVNDIKMIKVEEVDEERVVDQHWDDGRPPVFKSTFLEICCIVSIVCGQLTNVMTATGDGRI